MLAHPDSSAVLGARVARGLVDRLLGAHIPHADLLVARCRDQHGAAGVPRQTLDDVVVLQGVGRRAGGDVPEFDCEVAGCGRENVFRSGVELDLTDLSICYTSASWSTSEGGEGKAAGDEPRVASELADGRDIGGLLGIGVEGEVLRNLPEEDLSILRSRSNHAVVEGVPSTWSSV